MANRDEAVPSVPSQKQDPPLFSPIPAHDHREWEEDFSRWALTHCLFIDNCLWRVEALHDHFCDVLNARELVPCDLPTFAALLDSEGFRVTAGMIYGLVLKEEWLSLTAPERRAKAAPMWNGGSR